MLQQQYYSNIRKCMIKNILEVHVKIQYPTNCGCMHEQSIAGCVSTALNQPGNEATLRVIGHVHCMYLHSVFSMQLVCPRSPQARCSTTTTSTIPRRVAENVLRKIFGWFILICVVSCICIYVQMCTVYMYLLRCTWCKRSKSYGT